MKRVLPYLPSAVILIGLLVFVVSLLATASGRIPAGMDLPWSEFEDFVQGNDGSVYVSVRLYDRVLRYDHSGHFVRSYRAPGAGYADLATDSNGRIHVKIANSVYSYDADWNLRAQNSCSFYGDPTWILNSKGEAECAPGKAGVLAVQDRTVSPGELLFSSTRHFGRNHFDCADGSFIQRKGDRLLRYSSDGKLLGSYGTRWYLWWAKFPVPLAGAWLLMSLLAILENQKVRRILSRLRSRQRLH